MSQEIFVWDENKYGCNEVVQEGIGWGIYQRARAAGAGGSAGRGVSGHPVDHRCANRVLQTIWYAIRCLLQWPIIAPIAARRRIRLFSPHHPRRMQCAKCPSRGAGWGIKQNEEIFEKFPHFCTIDSFGLLK